MESIIKDKIFAVRPTNEEQNDYIITIGNHLATEKHFKSKTVAESYIRKKNWDMIVALIAEMIDISKNKEK